MFREASLCRLTWQYDGSFKSMLCLLRADDEDVLSKRDPIAQWKFWHVAQTDEHIQTIVEVRLIIANGFNYEFCHYYDLSREASRKMQRSTKQKLRRTNQG